MDKPDEPKPTDDAPTQTGGERYADGEGASVALPTLRTGLAADEVMRRLERRSTQGKLAGFEKVSATSFHVAAFGAPYDKRLVGAIAAEGSGSAVSFETVRLMKLPIIMAVVMALTIWPGVWLTDSLGATYFGWWPQNFWITAAWYLPLTLLALPVLWKQYKASHRAADEHARETVGKLAGLLEAS